MSNNNPEDYSVRRSLRFPSLFTNSILAILAIATLFTSAYVWSEHNRKNETIEEFRRDNFILERQIIELNASNEYLSRRLYDIVDPGDGGEDPEPCIIERLGRASSNLSVSSRSDADTYRARYRAWASTQPPDPERTMGYNLSDAVMLGMLEQVQLYSSDPNEGGVRAYFGIRSGAAVDTVLMLYPLDPAGRLRPPGIQTDILTILLENEYVRPCPRYCN